MIGMKLVQPLVYITCVLLLTLDLRADDKGEQVIFSANLPGAMTQFQARNTEIGRAHV